MIVYGKKTAKKALLPSNGSLRWQQGHIFAGQLVPASCPRIPWLPAPLPQTPVFLSIVLKVGVSRAGPRNTGFLSIDSKFAVSRAGPRNTKFLSIDSKFAVSRAGPQTFHPVVCPRIRPGFPLGGALSRQVASHRIAHRIASHRIASHRIASHRIVHSLVGPQCVAAARAVGQPVARAAAELCHERREARARRKARQQRRAPLERAPRKAARDHGRICAPPALWQTSG